MTASLRSTEYGAVVARILSASLKAVDPSILVNRMVSLEDGKLRIDEKEYTIPEGGRIFCLGIGKSSIPMAQALINKLGNLISKTMVVTKHAFNENMLINSESSMILFEGDHPLPGSRSLTAGRAVVDFVSELRQDDLLIFVLSGGGSALAISPLSGISLVDLKKLTSSMLACGASITELNILRRQLDAIKGGGLARMAKPARIVSLILSDVIGDSLETIASGPTTADPTTYEDALSVLSRYRMIDKQRSIVEALNRQAEVDHSNDLMNQVTNIIIGNNRIAAQAALSEAKLCGLYPYLLRLDLQGEAREAAVSLCHFLRWTQQTNDPVPAPACIVAGGETTVTLCRGPGLGGRNTELALAAVTELANFPGVMLVTLATDGEDGSTDAAGAIVTGETYRRAHSLSLLPGDFLKRNDSYTFFDRLGDLLRPGLTYTNVNDLVIMFTFPIDQR